MSDVDFENACAAIDKEKEYLNNVSQEIWKNPELLFEETHAHKILTDALSHFGFQVEKHYILPTAFKAEFSNNPDAESGTVAVLLEYDALPEIGHACGHNLMAEAGLGAAIAIKAAMQADPLLKGKLVVLGSPAEEGGAGKIPLIKAGAFKGVDAAFLVHPSKYGNVFPTLIAASSYKVEFKGKEAHAASFPWEGRNALDAAVLCYQSLAMMRQHIKPTSRINAVITKGGTVANVIPASSSMHLILRAKTRAEVGVLGTRVEKCMQSAAASTGCQAVVEHDPDKTYEDLLSNSVLGNVYKQYAEKLGVDTTFSPKEGMASTDMGNVSYTVPSIQPMFAIKTKGINHTVEFAEAAGSKSAQGPTLVASKAMAMTAIKVLRSAETRKEAKLQFERDLADAEVQS